MKAETFIEKLFGYLDEYPETNVVATEKGSMTPFTYFSVDNSYGDNFVRLKLSNEHEMPTIMLSELVTLLAGVSSDATITAVSIDDGTIYDIFDVYKAFGNIAILLKS